MISRYWMPIAIMIVSITMGCAGIPSMTIDITNGKELAGGLSSLFKDHDTNIEMIFVKGGCYQMGDLYEASRDEPYPAELPVHEVCVDDYYIGKYEVTLGQWKTILGGYPAEWEANVAVIGKSICSKSDCPAGMVSWNDAQEFLRKLNSMGGGKEYRLPTEAEWEYACRSGGKDQIYCGGNDVNAVAWYNANSNQKRQPVGEKKPNELGIYDMSGNQWEWTNDWYASDYYARSPKNNPTGPESGTLRTRRGGNVSGTNEDQRSARRDAEPPDFKNVFAGFRIVRTP